MKSQISLVPSRLFLVDPSRSFLCRREGVEKVHTYLLSLTVCLPCTLLLTPDYSASAVLHSTSPFPLTGSSPGWMCPAVVFKPSSPVGHHMASSSATVLP